MPKVLVFTYYWPPGAGPGVQRMLKFCKFLPQFGWKPVVISVKDGAYPSLDESLLDDIPKDAQVIKTYAFEPFRFYNALRGKKGKQVPVALIGIKDSKSWLQKFSVWVRANFFIPDARKGWNKYAIRIGKRIVKQQEVDAVITTGPPHSTHYIGKYFKEKHGLKWIADFRDPWVNIYYHKFFPMSVRTKKKHQQMETEIVSSADLIAVVSEGLKKEFSDRNNNIEVVYNGYDEDDFLRQENRPTINFTLSYIGNLKPNQNIIAIWEIIGKLLKEDADFAKHFKLKITGNVDDNVLSVIRKYISADNIEINPFVPHKEAAKLMMESNLLLFIIPNSENNGLILTGKLFEYLASGTTMLSIGPVGGNASEIIRACDRNYMIDYSDKAEIKKQLLNHFNDWKNNNQISKKHDISSAEKFSRKHQTEQLANAIFKLIQN